VPGLICAILALMIHEPHRGAAETHNTQGMKRAGSPYLLVLSIPTMWWIILSGALHNFNMYAFGAFLSPFLQRVHHVTEFKAGILLMISYGLSGIPGLIVGGMLGDSIVRRKPNGRLLVASISLLISVPAVFFALGRPVGDVLSFTILMSAGCACMYVYYSTVYSTIQDVIEPSLRGTAMAIYFFAMYVLGAALGPVGMGSLSDFFRTRALAGQSPAGMTREQLAPYVAQGLHDALYIIPVLGLVLTAVLFAGSRTVARDMERLQRWMKQSAIESDTVDAARVGAVAK